MQKLHIFNILFYRKCIFLTIISLQNAYYSVAISYRIKKGRNCPAFSVILPDGFSLIAASYATCNNLVAAAAMLTVSATLDRSACLLRLDHAADRQRHRARHDCQYNCCSHFLVSLQYQSHLIFIVNDITADIPYKPTALHSLSYMILPGTVDRNSLWVSHKHKLAYTNYLVKEKR